MNQNQNQSQSSRSEHTANLQLNSVVQARTQSGAQVQELGLLPDWKLEPMMQAGADASWCKLSSRQQALKQQASRQAPGLLHQLVRVFFSCHKV